MKLKRRRGWVKRICKVFSFLFACCIFISVFVITDAKETVQSLRKDGIVVLDCSKSMEDVDNEYLAIDFVKGLSAAVPRNYRIGVVAYNDEVCVRLPLGSSYIMVGDELEGIEYKRYGNAGAGLEEALKLFDDVEAERQIILISDGEIKMNLDEKTNESADLFARTTEQAKNQGIEIDIIALGPLLEEEYTVYSAAESTGGKIYELADEKEWKEFNEKFLFDDLKLNASHVGKISGNSGELSVNLPDCLMSQAKIILVGVQQNENLTVNCKADKINISKGELFTVIELLEPDSEDIQIRMTSDEAMDVSAYLTAEYDFFISTGHIYRQDMQTAEIWVELTNQKAQNLLGGYLKEGDVTVYLDNEKQNYQIRDGKIYIEKKYEQDGIANINISFGGLYASYYGSPDIEEAIIVPMVEEEPPKIDWFFWSVIVVFVLVLTLIFSLSWKKSKKTGNRKQLIEENRMLPKENVANKTDFYGKMQIYVIRNKDDIDYPPETINLFARCNREMITLEWLLDACNLPLNLKGAEKIIIKPGDDKGLIIKNNGKATALMGREFLEKGHSYRMYYNQKVTFIFDQDDTEIEVHYKNLKPNER